MFVESRINTSRMGSRPPDWNQWPATEAWPTAAHASPKRDSPHLQRHFRGKFEILLRVNLRYVGSRVTETHLGGFEAE